MSDPKIQPFPFDQLRKLTVEQANLVSGLHQLFCSSDGKLLEKITDSLKKQFGGSFSLRHDSLFSAPFQRFIAGLGDRVVVVTATAEEKDSLFFMELDPDLILGLIDHLLGGRGEVPRELRAPTVLEEGVIEYLVLRFLRELNNHVLSDSTKKFQFHRLATTLEEVQKLEESSTPFVLLTYRIKFKQISGYVRLAFPLQSGTQIFGWKTQESKQSLEKALEAPQWQGQKGVLWGEIGSVDLTQEEMQGLRKGDIILFDHAYPNYENEQLSGELKIRIGESQAGYIEGKIISVIDNHEVNEKNKNVVAVELGTVVFE